MRSLLVLVGLTLAASSALEPLTLNDDQSVPCTAEPNWVQLTADDVSSVLNEVPGMLDVLRRKLRAPGAAVIVVHGDEVIFFNSSGSAHADDTYRPFTRDTIVEIASNTKLFTTLAAYRLRDEGNLSLDDPVAKFLPAFKVQSPYASTRPIVLRSLATHSSGLVREIPACGDACDESTILSLLAKETRSLLFPQFTGTAYSNLGVSLLGRALEKVTLNQSYERYVESVLLAPMGMNNSGFNYTDAVRAAMAVGVDPGTGLPVPLPTGPSPWSAPAGMMYSTCADMAKFMITSMRHDLPFDPHGSQVVDGATFAEMQLHGTIAGQPTGFGGIGAGTYELAHIGNGTLASHWAVTKAGCLEGYRSDTFMIPSMRLGIFAVATSTCDVLGDGDAITFPIAAKLVPAVQAVLERKEAQAIAPPTSAWLPPAPARFLGAYCGVPTVNITQEANVLVLRNWDGVYPMQLEFVSEHPMSSNLMAYTFRMHMLGPYLHDPLCLQPDGENACPTSCMMRMGRSDKNFVTFVANATTAISVASEGLAVCCNRNQLC